jgi:hypothetical protein
MGMPTEPLLDLMRGTMANLRFVEEHAGPDGPFEVTQLINSFLAALVHPWEAMRNDFEDVPMGRASAEGWPAIDIEFWSDGDDKGKLNGLIRVMRNALAHGNLEFLSIDEQRNVAFLRPQPAQIGAIRLWNTIGRGSSRRVTWRATIAVADMRRFLERFADLIEERHRTHGWYSARAA